MMDINYEIKAETVKSVRTANEKTQSASVGLSVVVSQKAFGDKDKFRNGLVNYILR